MQDALSNSVVYTFLSNAHGLYDKVRHNGKNFIGYIRNHLLKQKITVHNGNGDTEVVEFAGANERVKKDGTNNNRRALGELERAEGSTKRLVILNAIETAKISKLVNHSGPDGHQWLDHNGWDTRKTYVMTNDGMIYPAFLHIAKTRDGRSILYDFSILVSEGVSIDKGATYLLATQTGQAVKVPTPSGEAKVSQQAPEVKNKSAEKLDIVMDEQTESVAPSVLLSERTWGNNIYSDELGDIALRKSSIKSEIRHGITAEKIASIEAIPSVIKQGKVILQAQRQTVMSNES